MLKNLDGVEVINGTKIIRLDEAKNDPQFRDENGQFDWEVFDKFRGQFPISIAKSQNMISFKLKDENSEGCTLETLELAILMLDPKEEPVEEEPIEEEPVEDSALVAHAKRELLELGYTPFDQEQEDGPDKWIQKNILELLRVFGSQGHSGSSASYCISMFNKLARYEPLTPLKLTDDEFYTLDIEDNILLNVRDNRVYIPKPGEKPEFMYAIVWENFATNDSFTGTAYLPNSDTCISSSQVLKGPCIPQSFHVPVFYHKEKDRNIIMEPEKNLQLIKDSNLYQQD